MRTLKSTSMTKDNGTPSAEKSSVTGLRISRAVLRRELIQDMIFSQFRTDASSPPTPDMCFNNTPSAWPTSCGDMCTAVGSSLFASIANCKADLPDVTDDLSDNRKLRINDYCLVDSNSNDYGWQGERYCDCVSDSYLCGLDCFDYHTDFPEVCETMDGKSGDDLVPPRVDCRSVVDTVISVLPEERKEAVYACLESTSLTTGEAVLWCMRAEVRCNGSGCRGKC